MKDALRVAGVLVVIAFVLTAGAAFAGTPAAAFAGSVVLVSVPELDPGLSIAGLALLGGTAAFVVERYRRRAK